VDLGALGKLEDAPLRHPPAPDKVVDWANRDSAIAEDGAEPELGQMEPEDGDRRILEPTVNVKKWINVKKAEKLKMF
jgi:hypothetical protein